MKKITRFFFFCTAICFMWQTHAQTQIGQDIDGEAVGDQSGYSVSMSTDGSIVAIGAIGNGSGTGHVRVYEHIAGTWTQVGADINGEAAGDQSGYSVSMSDDGSTVAIGAPYNDGSNGLDSGHVRVYKNIAGNWTQIGLDIDGEVANDTSGWSVSMSADGSIVAIGAIGNGSFSGHVRVYENMSGNWTQIGLDINAEAAFDASGWSVSLSGNGSTVAIGAILNGGATGHVRVYENMAGTWTQIGLDIDGEAAGDQSGNSVSMSADGSIVAIGAYGNGGGTGHVRVYENIAGTWTQIGLDIDGEAAGDQSGYSVSISADGSIVAIGAYGNGGGTGHVRVYQNIAGTWTQLGADIDGEAPGDQSGWSVSTSSDGNTFAIGAVGNGSSTGHVRVYELSPPCMDPTTPTVSESPTSGCPGSLVTLSIVSGNLNDATHWQWYSGSCGGTPVGSGSSINVYPVANTTYFARGEGGCVTSGTCGSVAVTASDVVDPTALCQDITVDLDASGNATITAYDVDNGSSDPCGIASMELSQYDFDCGDEGENTVTLTVTDTNGNTASCSAAVTINAIIPEVVITQSELPDFCQGAFVLLTATSNEEVTYDWNSGETSDVIEVSADGTYGVTVTSVTGCIAYEEYVIISFDAEATLSSYTLLATDDIKLEKDTNVLSGGVGVLGSDGKVKLKYDSHVAGFVRASEIDIDYSSSAGSSTLSPANVILPQFIYNTLSNNNSPDITVPENQAMTLYGDVYGKIDIKEGATVTFAQSNVYINELKTKENTTIEFSGCSYLYINKELKFDDHTTLNALGNKVVIYVDDDIEVKKGGSITASMYANDEHIKVDGEISDPTYMKGTFIGKKITGHDNVNWEWDTNCVPCTNTLQSGSGIVLDIADNENQYKTISLYPNPARTYVILVNPHRLILNTADIFDLNGRLIQTVDLRSMANERIIDVSLLEGAMYFVIIKGENNQVVKQLVKE